MWLNGKELTERRYYYDDRFKGKGTWGYEGQARQGTNDLLLEVSQLGLERGLAARALPPERAILSGHVLDAHGQPLRRNVNIAVWQGDRLLAEIRSDGSDPSGAYRVTCLPSNGPPCDISFTYGDQGAWLRNAPLIPGSRLEQEVRLAPAVSLSGTLSMLDASRSPNRGIVVQALRQDRVVASTLSDDKGYYRFVNLPEGDYLLRCHAPGGLRYYRPAGADADAGSRASSDPAASPRIAVTGGKEVRNLNFRFAPFTRGAWARYDTLDGLPNNRVQTILHPTAHELWIQTDTGLCRFDGQRFEAVPGTEGKSPDRRGLDRRGDDLARFLHRPLPDRRWSSHVLFDRGRVARHERHLFVRRPQRRPAHRHRVRARDLPGGPVSNLHRRRWLDPG